MKSFKLTGMEREMYEIKKKIKILFQSLKFPVKKEVIS